MAKQDHSISDELLAAYMDGNATLEETQMVLEAAAGDAELRELMELSIQVDEALEGYDLCVNPSKLKPLPMLERVACNMVDNLCVIRCEGYALRALGIDVSDEELVAEARQRGWLREEGIALHSIGQLSGKKGVFISRRYDSSLVDIDQALKKGDLVMAVIDKAELTQTLYEAKRNDIANGETPNHAVVIKSLDFTKGIIEILDPDSPDSTNSYPLETFLGAWEDSSNYMVSMSSQSNYEPHPLNLDDVLIEPELLELQESIAENAHDVWAKSRKDEGWTYGPVRDDTQKRHPDMLPYNLLPESEKEYDRLMAINTIKLVKKLGWDLKKRQ